MDSGNKSLKHRAAILLVAILTTGCKDAEQGFDAGARQADEDMKSGPPIFMDYYGAPGVTRLDGSLGLLVPECSAPRGILLEALDSGASGGKEVYDYIVSRTGDSDFWNRINDDYWSPDHSYALIECYATEPDDEPRLCTWLLMSRNAPTASKPWVLGYNHRVLERLAEESSCEHILWDAVEGWIDEL